MYVAKTLVVFPVFVCFFLFAAFFSLALTTLSSPSSSLGKILLNSIAPDPPGDEIDHLGVFAEGENVSSLLRYPDFFLPTCAHITSSGQAINMTLSKTNGNAWFEMQNVPVFSFLNPATSLIPLQPPYLLPNLTGVYQCLAPGRSSRPSKIKYQLEVVGKKIEKLCSLVHFLHYHSTGEVYSLFSIVRKLTGT